MNRRKFLALTGAASVVAFVPFKLAHTYQGSITRDALFPEALMPWQQYIWAMLQRGKQVMYVTSTQKNAWHVFNILKRHKNLHCTSMGAAICGRGADLIIMDEFAPTKSVTEEARRKDWYNSTIRTRLLPGGRITSVYT